MSGYDACMQPQEKSVYVWPSHFPSSCPPTGSLDLVGTAFRFINGSIPVDNDFTSHYERAPLKSWGNACQARGLSILHTWGDCGLMRDAVPALRKKKIAIADISTTVGVFASTPSLSCAGHSTWWRAIPPDQVRPLFTTFVEP